MKNKKKLSQKELMTLAILCSPEKEFVSEYERQAHVDGFIMCANFFQMLGWAKNELFFETVKMQMQKKMFNSKHIKTGVKRGGLQKKGKAGN